MNNEQFITDFNTASPPHNFTLREHLADGGQARIFLGADNKSREDAAVKVFHGQHDIHSPGLAFEEEANLLKGLDGSPNIVRVFWQHAHRANDGRSYPYTAMEYINGGTIKDRLIPGEPMPTAQAVSYLGQMMIGMMYAHGETRPGSSNGIVHRDLKPANILIANQYPQQITGFPDMSPYGVVKIADFGISAPGHINEETLTKTQVAAGTLPYMSSEQFLGKARFITDVRGVGIMGYEMLAGHLPITVSEGDTGQIQAVVQWYEAHRDQVAQPISDVRQKPMDPILDALQPVIARALSNTGRYNRMGDLYEAFSSAVRTGNTAIRKQQKHIDLDVSSKQPAAQTAEAAISSGTSATTPATSRTMHLGARARLLPEKLSGQPSRRGFLHSVGLLSTAVLLVSDVRKNYGKPEIDDSHEESPRQTAIRIAHSILKDLEANNRVTEASYLIKHLIPLEPKAMVDHIKLIDTKDQNLESAWLAAQLVPFEPQAAAELMQMYQNSGRYHAVAIVGAALASFGWGKPEKDPRGDIASQAADAMADTCDAQDQADFARVIKIAASPIYPRKLESFGEPTSIGDIIEEQKILGNYDLIQALAVAAAPYDQDRANDVLKYFDELLTKPNDKIESVSRAIREICYALGPYDIQLIKDELDRLDKNTALITNETSQLTALETAPYAIRYIADYVRAHTHEANAMGIVALGLAKAQPAVAAELLPLTSEDIKPWLRIGRSLPADKATEALAELKKDTNAFATRGGKIAAALLLAHTDKRAAMPKL